MRESGWTFEVESCVDVRAGGLDVPALRAKAVGINPINPLHVIEMDGVMRPEDENGYRDKAQSDLDLLRLGVRGLRLGIARVDVEKVVRLGQRLCRFVGQEYEEPSMEEVRILHEWDTMSIAYDAAVAELDGKSLNEGERK